MPVSTPSPSSSVDEVLRRDVAGRPGREGAAAEAADGGVEDARTGLERGEAVRVARVARVVAVESGRPCLPDERTDRGRSRDSDRVGKDDLGPVREPQREFGHRARIDASLERTAERARDRHRRRRLARCTEDRVDALDRLRKRRVSVPEIEGLGRRERRVDAVESGGAEALPASFVEDEARALDALAPVHALDHVLRAGHLRDAVGADEAHSLDPAQPGRREAVDELRASLRRQHLGLVLEPVPRPDVADEDLHRPSVLPAANGSRARVRAASAERLRPARRAAGGVPAPRRPRRP